LVPQDKDGFTDIYDARVGGGIPEPPGPPPPCSGEDCKPPPTPPPPDDPPGTSTFHGSGNLEVGAITAAQAERFARTGSLTLKADVPKAGEVRASVLAKLRHGKYSKVDDTSKRAGSAGEVTLSVHLSKAASARLARRGQLAVRVRVDFRNATRAADLLLRSAR
jgi:hypothetical protein